MKKTIEIKISGSGTVDQIAISLLEIGRALQVSNVYDTALPESFEDSIICAEINEE